MSLGINVIRLLVMAASFASSKIDIKKASDASEQLILENSISVCEAIRNHLEEQQLHWTEILYLL